MREFKVSFIDSDIPTTLSGVFEFASHANR
jgi:hypothetical protein